VLLASFGFTAAVLGSGSVAHAQIAPTMPTAGQPEETKPEGVAEQAPKTPGLLPTTPALPAPKSKRKKFELLELDGYFRLRSDWFKNFNLSFLDDEASGGGPFGCGIADGSANRCQKSHRSTNMRLRLEPTFAVNETTEVHAQIDVLDNVVLGSTPQGDTLSGTVPGTQLGPFQGNQDPPQAGYNSDRDSIAVKRAWAEIATPLGLIEAGRMPAHWGTGMLINGGGADPINGGYDLDADYGDTVDRLIFSTGIPGTKLRGAVGTDWLVTNPAANQSAGWSGRFGQPWDRDDDDDVNQWVFVVSKMDAPQAFKDTVERGKLALNYGAYVTYRTQRNDYIFANEVDDDTTTNPFPIRDAKLYTPDFWVKLGWNKLQFEAEGAAVLGKLGSVSDQVATPGSVDVRQLGGVARASYRAVQDRLRVGLEVGFATGDDWDNSPEGSTHLSHASYLQPGDDTLTRFIFNPDYKVDLILFRELIGAVSNATYVRPNLAYDLTKTITFKVQNVTSFANHTVSTPGNGRMYGIEFDGDLGYSSGGLFAGLSYGVLFPLSAMNHPESTNNEFPFGPFAADSGKLNNYGDAGTAHTLQARLAVQF
jgi:uncharacterized protein (TIGR04551 family)